MRRISVAGAIVIVVLAAVVGWSLLRRERGPVGFVLISVDTLRADHLGAYGYPLDTSPFFDELSARGTLFERAVVQLPGTLPSHMSIFTGLHPFQHGVYPPDRVLADDIATLPELFRAAGYRTAAFTEGGYVAGHYGFARGFEIYDDRKKRKPGGAADTFAAAKEFVAGLDDDERFFLFVHTYEVHDPYMALPDYLAWPGEPPDSWPPTGPNLTDASKGLLAVTPEALEYFVALYDASIRYVDDELRAFLEQLWADASHDTWVVVTSDHGEEFLEHGSLVHRQTYEPTLHVPLLFRRLGQRRGARVEQLVQSVDLAPTLLELAGLDGADAMSGRSLAPLLDGGGDDGVRHAVAEGIAVPSRAIYQQADGRLFQLVRTWRPTTAPTAIGSSVAFESPAAAVQLRLWAWGAPRELVVTVDGAVDRSLELPLDTPIELTLELDTGRPNRIVLELDGCSPPDAAIAEHPALRGAGDCVAALAEGPLVEMLELFDLGVAPQERVDLSDRRRVLTSELRALLESAAQQAQRRAPRQPLSDEQIERLRALGYLQ